MGERGSPGSLNEGTVDDCYDGGKLVETLKAKLGGWVNDYENPWVKDRENPQSNVAFVTWRPCADSRSKQRLNIPTSTQHAKNQNVFVPNTVDDDVLTHRKAPQAMASVVAATTDASMAAWVVQLGDSLVAAGNSLSAARSRLDRSSPISRFL